LDSNSGEIINNRRTAAAKRLETPHGRSASTMFTRRASTRAGSRLNHRMFFFHQQMAEERSRLVDGDIKGDRGSFASRYRKGADLYPIILRGYATLVRDGDGGAGIGTGVAIGDVVVGSDIGDSHIYAVGSVGDGGIIKVIV